MGQALDSVFSGELNKHLTVIGQADVVQVTVRSHNVQTANIQEWQDSDGTVLAQVQANGRMYTSNGLKADALTGGGSLMLWPDSGVVIVENMQTSEADYDYTGGTYESVMTDTDGVFEAAHVGKWVIVRTGMYKGAMAEITNVIDASNVILHTMGWDFDIASFGYYIIDHPTVVIGDGYHMEFHANSAGHFDIHSLDWIGNNYSSYLFEVELEAGIDDVYCGLFMAEANGYSQINVLTVQYESGDIQAGDSGVCVEAKLDLTGAASATSATEVIGYIADVTEGTSATTTAFEVAPGFTQALTVRGASSEDPDYGYQVDFSEGTVTDRVNGTPQAGTAFLDSSTSDVEVFSDDNDYVLIGSDATFEVIEWSPDTVSAKNIVPTFEYSTGNGTWSALTVLSDGTHGFTQAGQISFAAPGDWATGNEAESGGDITAAYYVKISRTYTPPISVLPVEDHFKTYASRATGMNVRGDGTVKPVSMADASAANDSIFYSTDQSKLVYKDSGGTVRDLY